MKGAQTLKHDVKVVWMDWPWIIKMDEVNMRLAVTPLITLVYNSGVFVLIPIRFWIKMYKCCNLFNFCVIFCVIKNGVCVF